uniref:Uncharacterized protein n=1 Tax=Romanomermis culicivorax TaxID=13658 RepID=A0A915HQR5_ROMCU
MEQFQYTIHSKVDIEIADLMIPNTFNKHPLCTLNLALTQDAFKIADISSTMQIFLAKYISLYSAHQDLSCAKQKHEIRLILIVAITCDRFSTKKFKFYHLGKSCKALMNLLTTFEIHVTNLCALTVEFLGRVEKLTTNANVQWHTSEIFDKPRTGEKYQRNASGYLKYAQDIALMQDMNYNPKKYEETKYKNRRRRQEK